MSRTIRQSRLAILATAAIFFGLTSTLSAVRAADGYETADGLAVYLGIVPAAVVRGHPANHVEGSMHGGTSAGWHEQHVVVAVFDAESGVRIDDASVVMTVSGLGHIGTKQVALEPMTIAGTVTYGGFVDFAGSDRYDIVVDINVPGRQRQARVNFTNDHLR